MEVVKFRFYATLLDAYQNYLDSDIIWSKYWGWSEDPPHTPEEFKKIQFQSLIDRINRVSFDSEAADKGTAFNEVIDCMVLHRNSKSMDIHTIFQEVEDYRYDSEGEVRPYNKRVPIGVEAKLNGRSFYFPIQIVRHYAAYYKGALPQVYIQAVLPTMYGKVMLYGYIDYLMPFCTHDLKTTRQYAVGNYKRHWQHKVYPYALMKNGCDVYDFEYNISEIGKTYYRNYTESYTFNPERDIPLLTQHCEGLISFIQENRDLITDKKIFNLV